MRIGPEKYAEVEPQSKKRIGIQKPHDQGISKETQPVSKAQSSLATQATEMTVETVKRIVKTLKTGFYRFGDMFRHQGNVGEYEEGERQQAAASSPHDEGEQQKTAAPSPDHIEQEEELLMEELMARMTLSDSSDEELKALWSKGGHEQLEALWKEYANGIADLKKSQEAELREASIERSGRSYSIDRMLHELSTPNRDKALREVKALSIENPAHWEEGANLYRLLLELEARTGAEPDMALHAEARNWLIQYIAKNPSLIQQGVLSLSPDFYAIYQHLQNESVAKGEATNLGRAIRFIDSGVTTGEAVSVLAKATQEYDDPPGEVSFMGQHTSKKLKALITSQVEDPKSDADYTNLGIPLAYLTLTATPTKEIDHAENFLKRMADIAGKLEKQSSLSVEEKNFLTIYRAHQYRKRVKVQPLGGDLSSSEFNKRLAAIKANYFKSKHPYSDQTLKVEERVTQENKLTLTTEPFEAQMLKLGKNWELSDIVALARTEGLPDSFLEQFSDHGASLYRDHIFPELLKTQGSESSANAEALESLLPANASALRRAEFWRNTIKFMFDDLKGSAIRKTQVENILKDLTKVGDKSVTIIQAAGAGKSTMARYLAKVLLRDVPFILFVSPFNEPRTGTKKLSQLSELAEAKPQNGKPPEFYITAEEYANLLNSAPSVEVKALRLGVQILDEFDSTDYRAECPRSVQEILAANGVNRVVNMSASDDDLKLLNKLERKQEKLADESREKKEGWAERVQTLDKDIKEILENIKIEFSRGMQIAETDFKQGRASGKSILLLHPDERDANTLAEYYTAELELESGNVLLYRNNEGERMARVIGKPEQPYDSFVKAFESMEPKPAVFCLYTKDSRGGDFERFSRQDEGQDHVVSQHISYKKIPPRNTLYQNLRRLRGNKRDVPVVLHLESGIQERESQAFIKRSQELQDIESRRSETVRLTVKIQRKMNNYVRAALESKWRQQIGSEKFQQYWTKEDYQKAVNEVLSETTFENSDPQKQYDQIQGKVTQRFLELANEKYAASQTKDITKDLQILKKLGEPKAAEQLWKARESAKPTGVPRGEIPKKSTATPTAPSKPILTVGDVWTSYFGLKTRAEAIALGDRLGLSLKTTESGQMTSQMAVASSVPGLVKNSIPETKKLKALIKSKEKDLENAKNAASALEQLRQLAGSALANSEMSREAQTTLRDVQYYQGLLAKMAPASSGEASPNAKQYSDTPGSQPLTQ